MVLMTVFAVITVFSCVVMFGTFGKLQDTNRQLDQLNTQLTKTKEMLSQSNDMLSQDKTDNGRLSDENAKLKHESQDLDQVTADLTKNKDMLSQTKDENSKLTDDNAKLKQELQEWDISLNSGNGPVTINEYYFNLNQKVRDQMHKFANKCVDDMSQIPSDRKIKWCQERIQGKIVILKQRGFNSAVAFYKQQLAECKDDVCQQRVQKQIDFLQQQEENRLDQLKSDLDSCPSNADQMLVDQCNNIETKTVRILDQLLNVNFHRSI
jgi:hypothetical protein